MDVPGIYDTEDVQYKKKTKSELKSLTHLKSFEKELG